MQRHSERHRTKHRSNGHYNCNQPVSRGALSELDGGIQPGRDRFRNLNWLYLSLSHASLHVLRRISRDFMSRLTTELHNCTSLLSPVISFSVTTTACDYVDPSGSPGKSPPCFISPSNLLYSATVSPYFCQISSIDEASASSGLPDRRTSSRAR